MVSHILDYKLPALAAVFLALGWFFSGAGPERAATVETGVHSTPYTELSVGQITSCYLFCLRCLFSAVAGGLWW